MANKQDLATWVMEAIRSNKGEATIIHICRYVWEHHEHDLRNSGNLFYTWGYDIRWAGQWLRDNEYLLPVKVCKRGTWVATAKGLKGASVP